jgi:hypothetical protein
MTISTGETNLLRHLDKLYLEGSEARSKVSQNWSRSIETIKGNTWPQRRPKYKVNAVMNFLSEIVERKAALLTDSRPTISVVSRKKLDDPICEILQKVIEGILDEKNFEQRLTEFVMLEEYFGFALINTCYDRNLDNGNGDIDLVVIDPRCFIFDPFVTRSWNLQFGEYCCLETIKPTDLLRDLNKERADDIKADLSEKDVREDSLIYKIKQFFNFDEKLGGSKSSTIPRSIVRDWWIRDRTTREKDKLMFPNWRHLIVAGGTIIEDGANPYLDGYLPFDAMEWRFNVDSAYGNNEIEQLESPQIMFNKLLATVLENALLMGNGIWVGDINAMTKEEWAKLTNEPGSIVKKKPGTSLERLTPPPLPEYMLATLNLLGQGLEKLSGITEVTEGRRPGQVCVDPKTECLTKRGWKKYHELLKTDEVYCFDPKTEVGMWSPLIGVAVYDWDDTIYSVKTDRMDCLVTPNHGWCVGDLIKKDWGSAKYQRVETKDLTADHYLPAQIKFGGEKKGFSDAFVKLVGWIVTEGCYSITTRENGQLRYRLTLKQDYKVNRENCFDIALCLFRCGLKDRASMFGWKESANDRISWSLDGQFARDFMEIFPDKRPTYEFIHALDLHQLDILYNTMLKGDGSSHRDVYHSADRELAEQFQMIAILSGHATRLVQAEDDPNIDKHRKPQYGSMCKVISRQDKMTTWRSLLPHLKKIPYTGKTVWCPQTLTGTWLARRNGVTYLTGNTSGTAIESLATMAQTTIRMKARQLENLIQRVGQKLISRIFAYYTGDRVFTFAGESGRIERYLYERKVIREAIQKGGIGIFQDYQFRVVPTSSLAMTKWQKGMMATQLFQLGLIDPQAALDALEFPNREEIMRRMAQGGGQGGVGFGQKTAPMKMPANLLRGSRLKEMGMQEPQK